MPSDKVECSFLMMMVPRLSTSKSKGSFGVIVLFRKEMEVGTRIFK